ncbi:MAG: CocE/NonD family hydrolase [Pseudomonadota bacterium]
MPNRSNSLRDIVDLPDEAILLSDGTRLSARIWRPTDADNAPVPVILEYLPYRKRDGTAARDALTHPWFAKRGYACLRVDMRGNGDSHGLMEDEYTQLELDDAVEVITWAAAQPWCTGAVGMMGISWGGFNALQVAAMAPEPLKAIITLCSTVDRFADDIHYKGGCLLNENLGWGATMWCYSSRAPDPALRADWRDIWMERLAAEPFLPATWLRHQRRDAYWRHGSVCEDYEAIRAATLAIGGWGDAYKNAVPALVESLSAPVKGIVGPWVHKYPHFAVPEPRIGFLQEALRWWDHWLKDIQTSVDTDPAYRTYLMDGVRPATWYTNRPGRWIAEHDGATSHLSMHVLHLADRALARTPEEFETVIASPQHCGMAGGEYCAIWLGPEMPGDQRADDALSACFEGDPLDTDLDIVGAPEVTLKLRCDQPQGQIAIRLNHVHPDGASTRITYGVLSLAHRSGHANPEPMSANEPIKLRVKLDHIAYRVPKGHRLRLSVSSAYWPLIWPSPKKTKLNLTGGALEIPVRNPATEEEWSFPPAESDTPWDIETLRPGGNTRRVETDLATGIVSLVIEDDFGRMKDGDHGLVSDTVARERWSIHPDDPLSAHGACHWTHEMAREDLRLRTETRCEMWSDATQFHLSWHLEAFENDVVVLSRQDTDSIPRDNL